MTPRRILQVAAIDFQVWHFLMPLMRELRRRGHSVEVAARDGLHLGPVRDEGFRVHSIPFSRSLDVVSHWKSYKALTKLLRNNAFDIVHGHYPVAGQLSRLAARRCGIQQIVYTSHGYSFLKPGNPLIRAAFFLAELAAARCQTTLFTQSVEEARLAERLLLAPRKGAAAIGNGVDIARFHPIGDERELADRAALRSQFGASDDTVVLVIVSRLVAHKGHGQLFAVAERFDNVNVWVVGDRLPSDHGDRIERLIVSAQERLGPRLCLLGSRHDVERVLRAADLFVLPSEFEGMPRTIAEAMMTGLPVVATDIRGTREQVIDGETGLLVPVKDEAALAAALDRLVSNPALRARMGKASLARARAEYDERLVIARQIALLDL